MLNPREENMKKVLKKIYNKFKYVKSKNTRLNKMNNV